MQATEQDEQDARAAHAKQRITELGAEGAAAAADDDDDSDDDSDGAELEERGTTPCDASIGTYARGDSARPSDLLSTRRAA